METIGEFGVLAAATILAAGAAFAMAWAFLRGAFRLMQPAGVTQPAALRPVQRPRLQLVRGTRAAAQGFARS